MKANRLVRSINDTLDEDAYSKLTLKQIYKKLGRDRYVKYLSKIIQQAVRFNKTTRSAVIDPVSCLDFNDFWLVFEIQEKDWTEYLEFKMFQDLDILVSYDVTLKNSAVRVSVNARMKGKTVSPEKTDVCSLIDVAINTVSNSARVKNLRNVYTKIT